jgi:hypothetical protein
MFETIKICCLVEGDDLKLFLLCSDGALQRCLGQRQINALIDANQVEKEERGERGRESILVWRYVITNIPAVHWASPQLCAYAMI